MGTLQTILVVEDQKDLRDLLQRCLAGAGFDVIVAGDGVSGLEIARKHKPALMILDLTLPGMDGLDVCRSLRSDPLSHQLPIIVLSARGSEAERIVGLDVGADDYLTKPFSARELLARVRAMLRRTATDQQSASILKIGDLEIDRLKYEVRLRDAPLKLRLSEFRVLQCLVARPGRVFTRDEIIESSADRENPITERTIDVHITRLRQILGVIGSQIETVRGVGYRFQPNPPPEEPGRFPNS